MREWRVSLDLVNTLVMILGLVSAGVGLYLGVVQGHALGSMVFILIGIAAVVLGYSIFKDDY